jgi:predicted dienelactone hydrolase
MTDGTQRAHIRYPALAAGLLLFASGIASAQPVPEKSVPPGSAPEATSHPAKLYKDATGPYSIRTIDEDWQDHARTRSIPVRIFVPSLNAAPEAKPESKAPGATEKFPVIVFSHGLGGSRIAYAYFARHLASYGYIVILPSHPGSDTGAAMAWLRTHGDAPARPGAGLGLRQRGREQGEPGAEDERPGGWLMSSINDPKNLRERPRDISFVLDQIPGHATLGPIADMGRIGVAGHSFGAYTAMAVGGMRVDLPEDYGGARQSFRDKRVRAVLPMSPEGSGSMGILGDAWDRFDVPVLFLTGTRDYGSGGRSASWRRQAFDAIRGVDDYLVTLENAGHMTFATPEGLLGGRQGKDTSEHSARIRSLGVAFFDAYVREDASAKSWLKAFATGKPEGCTPEFKPGK